MTGSDAIQAGFADSHLATERIPGVVASLVDPEGEPVADILEAAGDDEPVPRSALLERKPEIDRYFGKPSVAAILDELQTTTDAWAVATRAELLQKSPLALEATFAAIRRAKGLGSLEEALNTEFRLCTRLYEAGEFPEGVRALLVDKDKAPKWRPPWLADVRPAMVEALFQPVEAADEPGLVPPR
jgi:enoyl-CoA hydratase